MFMKKDCIAIWKVFGIIKRIIIYYKNNCHFNHYNFEYKKKIVFFMMKYCVLSCLDIVILIKKSS